MAGPCAISKVALFSFPGRQRAGFANPKFETCVCDI